MNIGPIVPMSLQNNLHHGETDAAELGAWSANVRQLQQFADVMTDLAADCVMERRKGDANEEHAYARIRANGHMDLARELVAIVGRLNEMEREARRELELAQAEYEFGRQMYVANRRGNA